MTQTSDSFDRQLRAAFEPSYQLERELTGGGMSRVFLATERALNRRVVIKVLPPELAAGVNRERFRREVQLAAQLQHPHIVPLYAAGEHGELLYYTMPFIEGESLKQTIHEHGKTNRMSPREVVGILHDVVDALAYAHQRGVIHRDIKPGNVLRSGRHAVVTDFGVAKAISASMPAVGMTTSGMAIGTPAYMAPEQLAGDPAADHRVDIYAVGLLAYELLTGDAPFAEASPQQTMAAQLTRAPEPIDRTRLDVPPALSALVMRCLAKSPEKRPQSAAELVVSLDGLELSSGNYPPTRVPARRLRAVLAALAVVAATAWVVQRQWGTLIGGDAAANDSAAAATAAAAAAPPTAPTLTRADSLAIAKAVQKKMEERAAVTSARTDSLTIARIANQLRGEIERAVLDSLAKFRPPAPSPPPGTAVVLGPPPSGDRQNFGGRQSFIDRRIDARRLEGFSTSQIDSLLKANGISIDGQTGMDGRGRGRPVTGAAFDQRAASMGPPRRVVIWDHPTDRGPTTLRDIGTAIMTLLRKKLSFQKRLVPVDRDSTLAVLAKTRDRDSVSARLGADVVATIRGMPLPGDSVIWTITVRDLTANSLWSQRQITLRASQAVPLVSADSLAEQAIRSMDELDRAPRAATPRTNRPPQSPQP